MNEVQNDGRRVWYTAGHLLIGTTKYFKLQAQFTYGSFTNFICAEITSSHFYCLSFSIFIAPDEAKQLLEKCQKGLIIIHKTQTIKRRT